jgi:hypothetical protein
MDTCKVHYAYIGAKKLAIDYSLRLQCFEFVSIGINEIGNISDSSNNAITTMYFVHIIIFIY